jgi:hypothetical protein
LLVIQCIISVGDHVSNTAITMRSRIVRRNSIRANQVYCQLYRTNYGGHSGHIYRELLVRRA